MGGSRGFQTQLPKREERKNWGLALVIIICRCIRTLKKILHPRRYTLNSRPGIRNKNVTTKPTTKAKRGKVKDLYLKRKRNKFLPAIDIREKETNNQRWKNQCKYVNEPREERHQELTHINHIKHLIRGNSKYKIAPHKGYFKTPFKGL